MLEGFFRFLFPPYCLGCLKDGPSYCCNHCLQKIERFVNSCPLCDEPTAPARVCGWCLRRTPLDALYIATPYDQLVLPELLTAFKFEGVLSLAHELGSLLTPLLANLPKPYTLIPLPLSRWRLQERGFNQSELLARTLDPLLLPQVRKTTPNRSLVRGGKEGSELLCRQWSFRQSKLSSVERARNVRGTFSCPKSELVKNKTVVLLDDLYTTGATLGEAAQTLKAAGAKKVIGVALAKG